MKIGGWRTHSVFERYSIVTQQDVADAMRKLNAWINFSGHFGEHEN
jgi:hypothetical protein